MVAGQAGTILAHALTARNNIAIQVRLDFVSAFIICLLAYA